MGRNNFIAQERKLFILVISFARKQVLVSSCLCTKFISKPLVNDKFKAIKEKLISIFANSDEQKLRKPLNDVELGNQKPS